MYITLDKVICDWVTLTGKEHYEIREQWSEFVASRKDFTHRSKPMRWLQWRGDIHYFDGGSVFTGSAEISGEDWLCVRASGELSEDILFFFMELVDREVMKVTRVDAQVTVKEPDGWGQINFCNRMHVAGKTVDMMTSNDNIHEKTLQTVAIGSRKNATYTRVYQKLTNAGERLLRFEVEWKSGKARAIVAAMKTHTLAQSMKHHLLSKIGDEKLTAVFANSMEGVTPANHRPKVQVRDKKKDWLLRIVLPSFEEYINDHADDGEVIGAWLSVLEEFLDV
jgi:hypothetical protein